MATDVTVRPRKRNDAYTGLLAVSFLALVGGCVLLYMDLEQYKDGDKLKTAPDPLKIDVPGTQLKVIQGSGAPVEKKKEPEMPPEMPPMMDPMMPPPMMPMMPPMMMMRDNPKKQAVPAALPSLETTSNLQSEPVEVPVVVSPVQPIQAAEPVRRGDDPLAAIPDPSLPPPPAAVASPMIQMSELPALPASLPNNSNEPPVMPKRFLPPM